MKFTIDKQTLEELNLLGKFRQGTIYHLFNQLRTRGGEQLLDDMFRAPMTDAEQINARSAIFQYFQQQSLPFPFEASQVAEMREYLDARSTGGSAMVLLRTLYHKILSGLTRDERYKKSVQGLQATINVVKICAELALHLPVHEDVFGQRLRFIKEILAHSQLQRLREIDIYSELPVQTLAFFEHLLKGPMQAKLEEILSFIYELDVYIAISTVAARKGFRYAKAWSAETNVLRAANLRHPAIEGAIGNDLHLNEDSNVLFLTGANMAGKSTWMKSLGIGLYLAHMGFPIAADSFEFSVRDGLYSSINVADDISLGYSHFYAEVMRVKQAALATASGKRLMLMFDELFKGTNVKDAYDGTLAVIEGFAEYRDCLFVVSTHIIEVGEALRRFPNIQFRYMPTFIEGTVPRYTYRMQNGITEDRQGMMIIRNEGILELING